MNSKPPSKTAALALGLLLAGASVQAQPAISRAVFSAGGGAGSAGVYAVVETIGESPGGTASSANYSVSDGFWETFDSPIAPSSWAVTNAVTFPVTIPIAALLAAADSDGNSLTLVSVDATSAHGGTVAVANGFLTYTPVYGFTGTDTFSYTVTDASGNRATGMVMVTIALGTFTKAPTILAESVLNRQFQLHFTGATNGVYSVLASSNLTAWAAIGQATQTAPGVFDFTDTNSPAFAHRYYKLRVESLGAPPTMLGGVVTNGNFRVLVASSGSCRVFGSTNLTQWTLLGAATSAGTNLFQFTDTDRKGYRFYRASSP